MASHRRAETIAAKTLGVVAVLVMLLNAFGASLHDQLLHSPWGDDSLQHLEIVEVLPYFFWFAVGFALLLGRRVVASVACNGPVLCWAAAGAVLSRWVIRMLVGDLTTPDNYLQGVSAVPVDAAGHVITWLCIIMGAAAGAVLAQTAAEWLRRRTRT
jgi:hypothetical protein